MCCLSCWFQEKSTFKSHVYKTLRTSKKAKMWSRKTAYKQNCLSNHQIHFLLLVVYCRRRLICSRSMKTDWLWSVLQGRWLEGSSIAGGEWPRCATNDSRKEVVRQRCGTAFRAATNSLKKLQVTFIDIHQQFMTPSLPVGTAMIRLTKRSFMNSPKAVALY